MARDSLEMRSEDALDEAPLAGRDEHWLSSPARDGKAIWETIPFLLVGAGAWDTDVASFPEPAMARYGRVAHGQAGWGYTRRPLWYLKGSGEVVSLPGHGLREIGASHKRDIF